MSQDIDLKPLCGIDEAGRGPIAGPLVIAGVVLLSSIDGLRDSKRLTQKSRERLYPQIISASKYHIVTISHTDIDRYGISKSLNYGIREIMRAMGKISYLFDGNSTFGVGGIDTMVKADDKIDEVSAASILAKVTRDRMMDSYAIEYPEYGFERHKGYGTVAHIEALKIYGRSPIHRKSFRVKAIDEPTLFV
jgi:ribonuclease HII